MFAELVELGKRVSSIHPSLDYRPCEFYINISENGDFNCLNTCDGNLLCEYIPSTAKKGKARLLLDNAEYTLGFETTKDCIKNHNTYIQKLEQYKNVAALSPVFSFYSKPHEIEKALNAFMKLPKSKQKGDITFMVNATLLLKLESVQEVIKQKYDEGICTSNDVNHYCAVCGSSNYPIIDIPHGGVNLPGSDKKCSLVSYNKSAFESYGLVGNLNSSICTNCARYYVKALDYLTHFEWITNEKGKKDKEYKNARELSDDTLIAFWTKNPTEIIDLWSDDYQVTEERMRNLFSSVTTGNNLQVELDVDNYFYCCTLSSAAARIAVRDWVAMSIPQYQKNIKQWFEDIATIKDEKIVYPGINTILNNCIKKKSNPTKSDFKAKARIGSMLWHAALTNTSLPEMILLSVLNQIEHQKETKKETKKQRRISNEPPFSEAQSTVIRLVLNRNIKNCYKMKKELDEQNESKAYLCGRLFALVCKLQLKAQGKVNNSIKNRFFVAASNMPGRVMGILLTKYVPVYERKEGTYIYTKGIMEVATRIGHFPDKFSLMDRGEFALGYYYQWTAKLNDNNTDQGQIQ